MPATLETLLSQTDNILDALREQLRQHLLVGVKELRTQVCTGNGMRVLDWRTQVCLNHGMRVLDWCIQVCTGSGMCVLDWRTQVCLNHGMRVRLLGSVRLIDDGGGAGFEG